MRLRSERQKIVLFSVLLLILGAIAYLPLINKLGLYLDDWFLIYDAHSQGAQFMRVIFSSDRPMRGYFMEGVYALFGDHLVYYHLSAFAFRYLGTLAFFFTLNKVWKQKTLLNFWITLLVFLYPAFVDQVSPVDFQAQIASLFLAYISIALSIQALMVKNKWWRVLLIVSSVIFGWAYLGLIDYHIGFEGLRVFFIYIYLTRYHLPRKQTLAKTVLYYLPYLIIPIGFFVWRTIYFQGLEAADTDIRAATDISFLFENYISSPLHTLGSWGISLVLSLYAALAAGWIVPLFDALINDMVPVRDSAWILGLSFLVASLVFVFLNERKEIDRESTDTPEKTWIPQATWGGLFIVIVGLLPIILVDRSAGVGSGGRYLLAAAPGAAMILVALIQRLAGSGLKNGLLVGFLFISLASHLFNTVNHVIQAEDLRNFWWQVSWRAPQIKPGTTIVASYYKMVAPEESTIWGPANLIYYPEKQAGDGISLSLPALLPSDEYAAQLLGGIDIYSRVRRGNLMVVHFEQLLVMARSSPYGCVRVIDGAYPELEPEDPTELLVFVPFSDIDTILPSEPGKIPPASIFGEEPEHTWCYYYQKASLARQTDDWSTILNLYEETKRGNHRPSINIEWMPFLQALVADGRTQELELFIFTMADQPYLQSETCLNLSMTAEKTRPEDEDMRLFISKKFCNGATP